MEGKYVEVKVQSIREIADRFKEMEYPPIRVVEHKPADYPLSDRERLIHAFECFLQEREGATFTFNVKDYPSLDESEIASIIGSVYQYHRQFCYRTVRENKWTKG